MSTKTLPHTKEEEKSITGLPAEAVLGAYILLAGAEINEKIHTIYFTETGDNKQQVAAELLHLKSNNQLLFRIPDMFINGFSFFNVYGLSSQYPNPMSLGMTKIYQW